MITIVFWFMVLEYIFHIILKAKTNFSYDRDLLIEIILIALVLLENPYLFGSNDS